MRSRALALGLAASLLACSYGPKPDRRTDFVLFYRGGSDVLDPAAAAIVARAASAAAAAPDLDVTVAGYADAPAAPESNQILSRIRAQIVANALVARGVARERIHLLPRRALGADPGDESHRVDIRIGS
jgi:outer membrane protein OmpA-like peptidoglycan-associated protein